MKALVFDIYKGTTHDGPGVRDTVFLKGCPLKCRWCHNPEGMDFGNGVWYEKHTCIGCGECMKACRSNALTLREEGIFIDYSLCKNCMLCESACPAHAIERIADEYTPEEVAAEILKDKEYFDVSGGGVTLSGGEAMAHHQFAKEFFRLMKENGISTALDTSGFCDTSALKEVLEYTDILLYDLKVMDSKRHIKWTGVDNRIIIENILKVKEQMKEKILWIRTPLIPGYTADEDVISEIAAFIRDNLRDCVKRWELCAFNNSCNGKYDKLHKAWDLENAEILSKERADFLLDIAKTSGIKEVICSGITKQ